MIRYFIAFFILTNILLAQTTPRSSSYPAISYVVKEVGAKDILMSKNSTQRIAPASLTKVLTTSIALEVSDLNAQVTVPYEATIVEPSKAGFKAGEVFTMRDLIEAALVHSANDAAYTIAYHIGGGDINKFVALMNAKAQTLGMTNSHFTNPAGFDLGDHYSTARDLLKLAEFAIRNKTFNDIVKMQSTSITAINTGNIYKMHTSNKLLGKYQYAVGIKTGYTKKAGPCLIARAQKDNKDIIIVLLKSQVNRWGMTENIFEKAYAMNSPEVEYVEDSTPGVAYQKLARQSNKNKPKMLTTKKSKIKYVDKKNNQKLTIKNQRLAKRGQTSNAN